MILIINCLSVACSIIKKILFLIFFLYLTLGYSLVNDKCSSKKNIESLFIAGQDMVYNANYIEAIKYFQLLNNAYPINKYSDVICFNLIFSFYNEKKFSIALNYANEFVLKYPYSEYISTVYYFIGIMKLINKEHKSFHRFFSYDISQYDVNFCFELLDLFQKSIITKNNYNDDAKVKILYLKNKISEHYYKIAKFYFDKEAYLSAINRSIMIVECYHNTIFLEKSLILMIKSYNHLKMFNHSKIILDKLKFYYPKHKYYVCSDFN